LILPFCKRIKFDETAKNEIRIDSHDMMCRRSPVTTTSFVVIFFVDFLQFHQAYPFPNMMSRKKSKSKSSTTAYCGGYNLVALYLAVVKFSENFSQCHQIYPFPNIKNSSK